MENSDFNAQLNVLFEKLARIATAETRRALKTPGSEAGTVMHPYSTATIRFTDVCVEG
jgi:hypothetical protein